MKSVLFKPNDLRRLQAPKHAILMGQNIDFYFYLLNMGMLLGWYAKPVSICIESLVRSSQVTNWFRLFIALKWMKWANWADPIGGL